MSAFDTRCPVVRGSLVRFVEHVTVGGASRWEEFFRRVIWVRESRARCRALHGGVQIATLSQCHDFYGLLTSADGAVGDARRQADRFSATATSSLVILAEVEVFERPALEIVDPDSYQAQDRARMRERYGIERYANVPQDWRLPLPSPYPDLPDARPTLDTVVVAPWAPVWSSAEPELDPGLVLAVLRRRWAP